MFGRALVFFSRPAFLPPTGAEIVVVGELHAATSKTVFGGIRFDVTGDLLGPWTYISYLWRGGPFVPLDE